MRRFKPSGTLGSVEQQPASRNSLISSVLYLLCLLLDAITLLGLEEKMFKTCKTVPQIHLKDPINKASRCFTILFP